MTPLLYAAKNRNFPFSVYNSWFIFFIFLLIIWICKGAFISFSINFLPWLVLKISINFSFWRKPFWYNQSHQQLKQRQMKEGGSIEFSVSYIRCTVSTTKSSSNFTLKVSDTYVTTIAAKEERKKEAKNIRGWDNCIRLQLLLRGLWE